jgi:hypothetical protein
VTVMLALLLTVVAGGGLLGWLAGLVDELGPD